MRTLFLALYRWAKTHRFFLSLLACVGVVLLAWLVMFRPWSAWVGGDLQSINTLRFWMRDGYWHHYGLFLTQGYSPFIQLLEQPTLWHHGLGSIRHVGTEVAQSIYYNHYPTTYLIPLFLTSQLIGSVRLLPLQIVQLLISLSALVLMYAALTRVARARDAALVTLISGCSWLFTNFAYSLNNLPLDDFFRWSFLLFSLLEIAQIRPRLQRTLMWLALFLLSLVSLDSIIFCSLWLVFSDLLHGATVYSFASIRRWAVYATAPILAQGLVFLESVAAWGWENALADKTTSFQTRSMEEQTTSLITFLKQRFYAWSLELYSLWFGNLSLPTSLRFFAVLLAACFVLFVGYLLWKRKDLLSNRAIWLAKLCLAAFFAALGFAGVVPVAGYMLYQGRQFIPFFPFFSLFLLELYHHQTKKALPIKEHRARQVLSGAALILAACMVLSGLRTIKQTAPSPVFGRDAFPSQARALGDFLRTQTHEKRAVAFVLDPKEWLSSRPREQAGSFAYQLSVLTSYTADRLLLAFGEAEALRKDVQELRRLTNEAVIPIFVTTDASLTEELQKEDFLRCASEQPIMPPVHVSDWFIATGASCSSR